MDNNAIEQTRTIREKSLQEFETRAWGAMESVAARTSYHELRNATGSTYRDYAMD